MAKRKISHGHAVAGKPKPRKNHCFGCGHDNPQGMRLKFSLDEESRQAICHFKLSRKYTGPPGYAHGGIIATILDEAMGKVSNLCPWASRSPLPVRSKAWTDVATSTWLKSAMLKAKSWHAAPARLLRLIRKKCLPGTAFPLA